MLRTVTLALLLMLPATAAAPAETPSPSLKASVTVTSDIVNIGDLVDNAGEFSDVPIFRSPDLGTTGSVPAARVREALRSHGLAELETGGISEVVVTRPGRAVTAKEIEHRILQALAGQRGLPAAEDLRISVDQALRTFYVEANATAELQVLRLTIDPYLSRYGIVLDIPGSAILRRTPLRLSGRIVETAEALVLAHAVQRGDVIRHDAFTVERRPRAEIGKDGISRPERAVGLAVRRPLRAGHVLTHTDLMKPELVRRNEPVTLVYEVPGIVLTIRGQAAESGSEGDVINVLNLQSKRTVQGTVTGPGRVTVTGTGARIGSTTTASLQAAGAPGNK